MQSDVIMRDMDQMRKELMDIQAEGRMSKGRLEASVTSINDLIRQRENLADTRMSEMSVVMREKESPSRRRLKLMSEHMQRRDSDANNCTVEFMTTMQDLTLRERAVVAQALHQCQRQRARRTYPPPAHFLPRSKPRTGR